MDQQRQALETEIARFKAGQVIMEMRVEEMRIRNERGNQKLREAEVKRRKHDRGRVATRWLSGLAGTALILGTGGGAAEILLQSQRALDRKRLDELQQGT